MRTRRRRKLPQLRLRLHPDASIWEAAGMFRIQAMRQTWPPLEREMVIDAAVVSEGVEFLRRYCDEV